MEMLKATPLYAYLEDRELQQLASAFVRQRVKAGKVLPESPFYIVLSGIVDVRQNDSSLCHKGAGSFFSRHAGEVDDDLEEASRSPPRKSSMMAKRLSIMGNRDRVRRTSRQEDNAPAAPSTEFRTINSCVLLVILPAKLTALKGSFPEMTRIIDTMSHANLERCASHAAPCHSCNV